MSVENELEDFQLSDTSSQQQSVGTNQRPSTPPNLSKNQAKKWRKKWDFEEKQRIKKIKTEQKKQKQTQTQKQKRGSAGRVLPQYDNPHTLKKTKKAALVDRIPINGDKQISMFAHLPQNEKYLISIASKISGVIHPVIVRAGLYYNDGSAWGANTRCIIMLNALNTLVKHFECDHNKSFIRELLNALNQSIQFLNDCRPQSVSMGNTIRWLKSRISEIAIAHNDNEEEQRSAIISAITQYVFKIETADKMIEVEVMDRICDGDVILTYARSYVVEKSLIRAYNEGKQFSVVIVDARPHNNGKYLLSALSTNCPSLDISYTLINSASYVMSKNVNKVILGAASVMSNGSVVSRNGTAIICLLAKHYKIPVMVCCETYKFSERVQIDSICSNELGDFDALIRNGRLKRNHNRNHTLRMYQNNENMDSFACAIGHKLNVDSFAIDADDDDDDDNDAAAAADDDENDHTDFKDMLLGNWRHIPKLKMLNLKYDTTPSQLFKMVITELGVMPPSAAPVIIRECHKDRYCD